MTLEMPKEYCKIPKALHCKVNFVKQSSKPDSF